MLLGDKFLLKIHTSAIHKSITCIIQYEKMTLLNNISRQLFGNKNLQKIGLRLGLHQKKQNEHLKNKYFQTTEYTVIF